MKFMFHALILMALSLTAARAHWVEYVQVEYTAQRMHVVWSDESPCYISNEAHATLNKRTFPQCSGANQYNYALLAYTTNGYKSYWESALNIPPIYNCNGAVVDLESFMNWLGSLAPQSHPYSTNGGCRYDFCGMNLLGACGTYYEPAPGPINGAVGTCSNIVAALYAADWAQGASTNYITMECFHPGNATNDDYSAQVRLNWSRSYYVSSAGPYSEDCTVSDQVDEVITVKVKFANEDKLRWGQSPWDTLTSTASWEWGSDEGFLEDPAWWKFYSSTSSNGTYTLTDYCPGSLRELELPDTALWYRVVGADGYGNEMTLWSDPFTATAVAPEPTIDLAEVEWVWACTNPTYWALFSSPTQNGTYTLAEWGSGSIRELEIIDFDLWYYLVGLDAAFNPITEFSGKFYAD